jgi:hypothetical protein
MTDTGGPSRLGLALGLLVGTPMMLFGVVALVQHTDATPPSSFLKLFLGGNVVHDAIVAPVAAAVGVLIIRRLPHISRGPVRAALFASAIAVGIAWPALRGYGRMRAPDNTTVQPLNYATAVATVLAVVWLICAIWFVAAVIRQLHRP